MAAAAAHKGVRANRPGLRRVLRLALPSLAVLAGISYALNLWPSTTSHSSSGAATYGGLPSWLPKTALPVGRVVTASTAHPWLAIEGDTVVVVLAHGRVSATAVGPEVPEEGRFPVPPTSPCSFTVTFTDASGSVPISPAAFSIVDELGKLHHPHLKIEDQKIHSTTVTSGHTVTITLNDVLPTGNGQLRWAPEGGTPIVSWDFDVEID